jgi:hypothetical protein
MRIPNEGLHILLSHAAGSIVNPHARDKPMMDYLDNATVCDSADPE